MAAYIHIFPLTYIVQCIKTFSSPTKCINFLRSIGYPVVTLGFGFKSYVSYKMRLRKQKEVQKENEFYMQLLQQALPPEQQMLQRQEREAEEGKFEAHKYTQRTNETSRSHCQIWMDTARTEQERELFKVTIDHF